MDCQGPWTLQPQAALSMGFSRQEYQSGSPGPPPEDLPDPGIPAFPCRGTSIQSGREITGRAKSKLWLNPQCFSCPAVPRAQPGATHDPGLTPGQVWRWVSGGQVVSERDSFKLHTVFSFLLKCSPTPPS